ncbi:recombinase family protein [Pasteurella multocida]
MALIGFARVSTKVQDLSEQITQLKLAGCTKIFEGKNSGRKECNEERLKELMNYVREDDIIIATKIDRLGRSSKQLLQLLFQLEEKKVFIKTLDGWLDTTKQKDIFSMVLAHLMAMFAELDRNIIITRTQEGKRAKIAAGDYRAIGGRPKLLSTSQERSLVKDIRSQKFSLSSLSKKYNVSRGTISRYKKMYS